MERITAAFNKQITGPCGGFLNPAVDRVEHDTIVFRCHYENYDNDEDAWEFWFNPVTFELDTL